MQPDQTGVYGNSDDEVGESSTTCKNRYDALAVERTMYLQRARDCALVTVPALFPPQGHNSATPYPTPFQSAGADGLNNLSSKILLAIFPPGNTFFRLQIDDFVVAAIVAKAGGGQEGDDARARFEEALNKVERAVCNRLESKGARTQLGEAIDQLLVSGNVCLQVRDDGGLLTHRLENYVVKRDIEGNPIEVITRQALTKQSLPKAAQQVLADAKVAGLTTWADNATDRPTVDHTHVVDLYTRYSLDDDTWHVYQEIVGREIPGTRGTDPKDKPRFIPVRWTAIQGEDYGRGFVEEYLGDLQSLEGLSKNILAFGAIASKVLIGVNESGTTSKEKIARAPSGAVVDGDLAKDVTFLKVDKMDDFSVVERTIEKIEARLNRAFLRSSTVQRDAERVTAEEVRYVANELETTLGANYAILGQELQYPIVVRVMANMMRDKALPPLPPQAVKPQIVAGLDGLGRQADLDKYERFVKFIVEAIGQPAVPQYLNVTTLLKRAGTSLQIDMDGLALTEDQIQQNAQQANQQENLKAIAPKLVDAASKHSLQQSQQAADSGQAPQSPAQGQ